MEERQRPCERCGQPIPEARLEVMPETRICKPCSETIGGEFEVSFTRESLGRPGAIKQVTGGVGRIIRRRKRIERLS
jgi:hypothetical protein